MLLITHTLVWTLLRRQEWWKLAKSNSVDFFRMQLHPRHDLKCLLSYEGHNFSLYKVSWFFFSAVENKVEFKSSHAVSGGKW